MSVCHRPPAAAPPRLALLASFAAALLPALAVAKAAAVDSAVDADVALARADEALQRGDCGVASRLYREASGQLERPELAARAAEVALGCGQYPAARAIAAHWLQFSPGDAGALLAAVQAGLGGYQIADAQRHFRELLAADRSNVPGTISTLAQRSGSEATLAMLRGADASALAGAEAQLAQAAVALDAWNAQLALHYTGQARGAGAHAAAAGAIDARAYAILGQADAAAEAARQAAAEPSGRLVLAQALMLLGDDSAAQAELTRLRNDAAVGAGATRLLAQLAMQNADYAVAEQRCLALINDAGSAPLAVYYLGIIAERRGDEATASRDYALLANTALEPQARRRAAAILYRQGDRDAAVRILSAPRDATPEERIRGELAAADLLSVSGAADEAVSRIDSALRRSPGNPEISYQRAVLLERAGRVDAAIATLEALHRERPLDPGIGNALGYTLADHRRELPRAEQLIRAALAAQPDNPALLDSLGWVLHRRGQHAAAIEPLARAFRLLHDGDIGAHWGEVLWAAGRKAEARSAWQRALDADPENQLLASTVRRYAPKLKAPKPPPALEPAPRTSI